MAKLFNLARVSTGTTGTGPITLGSAVAGFLTFAQAGVSDGDVVEYSIQDGNNSEKGTGTYTTAGTTLTRTVITSTNSNTAISLSGAAQVFIDPSASCLNDASLFTTGALKIQAVTAASLAGSSQSASAVMINGTVTCSVNANILTVNIKNLAGNDPSAADPVFFAFRNATIATGDYTIVSVTSALSINTNAAGATLGTANNQPFRHWLCAFNNGGTVVLALWQSVTGGSVPTAVAALDESSAQSTTAMSGSATAAGTFYTPNGTTLTSKAFRIIGYLEYASGLATAGSYSSTPTKIQLFGPGINKPGNTVQSVVITTNSTQSTTGTTLTASTLSGSITPSSAANVVKVVAAVETTSVTTFVYIDVVLRRGTSTNIGPRLLMQVNGTTSSVPMVLNALDGPGAASSTTYGPYFASGTAGQTVYCPGSAAGTPIGYMTLEEVMT